MVKQTKEYLRKQLLAWRAHLPDQFVKQASKQITNQLIALPTITGAAVIGAYLPASHEVDTQSLIDWCLIHKKRVVVPASDEASGKYRYVRFRNWQQTRVGRFGIKEPYPIEPVNPTTIEVAVVPGLAFDQFGNRLGFGSGIFDHLLAHLRSDCPKIGVCFTEQVLDDLPVEKHDVRVDYVFTNA